MEPEPEEGPKPPSNPPVLGIIDPSADPRQRPSLDMSSPSISSGERKYGGYISSGKGNMEVILVRGI